MKNLINTPKITDIEIFDENKISAKINGRMYIGQIWKCGEINCVSYLREMNSNKQTTARIKSALESKIN